jgi:hypothetical protein
MKTSVAAILVVSLSLALTIACSQEAEMTSHIISEFESKDASQLFPVWHYVFGKSYELNSGEGKKRFNIFKDNLDYIREKNAQNLGFKLGVNKFVDQTNEEYKKLFTEERNANSVATLAKEVDASSETLKYLVEDKDEKKLFTRHLRQVQFRHLEVNDSPRKEIKSKIYLEENAPQHKQINFDREADKLDQEELRIDISQRFKIDDTLTPQPFNEEAIRKNIAERFIPYQSDLEEIRKSIESRFDASKISDETKFDEERFRKDIAERFIPYQSDLEELRKSIESRFDASKISDETKFDEESLRKDIAKRFDPNQAEKLNLNELKKSIMDRFDASKIPEETKFDEESFRKEITERFNPNQAEKLNLNELRKSIESRFDASKIPEETKFDEESFRKEITERFNPNQAEKLNLNELRKSIESRFDASKIPENNNFDEESLRKDIAERFIPNQAETSDSSEEILRKNIEERFENFSFNNFRNIGLTSCTECSEGQLKDLLSKGAYAVMIDASSRDFQLYSSGILKIRKCGEPNHGVFVTEISDNFIRLRNSFGERWGENGYIRIARDPETKSCHAERNVFQLHN